MGRANKIMSPLNVLGLGDPVMDLLANVSHEFLATVTQEPGGCFTVQSSEMTNLLANVAKESEIRRLVNDLSAEMAG